MKNPVFSQHAWLIFVIANAVNAFALRSRSRSYIREHPNLATGYRRLFAGALFWGSLPWLFMGAGLEFGGVHNIFSYYCPRDGNPFVLAWLGLIVVLWLAGFYWVFARRGAEFLSAHPGLLNGQPKSPASIRMIYCAMTAGGVVGLYFMFYTDMPDLFK